MAENLVGTLTEAIGEELRSVAEYDHGGYDLHYIRDDVETAYSSGELDAIHDDLVLEGIGTDRLEDLFNVGELRCTMHGFEEAIMFHFPKARYRGLFVSIDAETDVPLPTLLAECNTVAQQRL